MLNVSNRDRAKSMKIIFNILNQKSMTKRNIQRVTNFYTVAHPRLHAFIKIIRTYYHLRSTVKRERFFAKVYFSNVNGLVS